MSLLPGAGRLIGITDAAVIKRLLAAGIQGGSFICQRAIGPQPRNPEVPTAIHLCALCGRPVWHSLNRQDDAPDICYQCAGLEP